MQAPSLKRPLEIGKMHDGLYFLCSDCLQKNSHAQHYSSSLYSLSSNKVQCTSLSCNSHSDEINSSLVGNKDNVANNSFISSSFPNDSVDLLWHYRLGHVPFVKMKNISSIPAKFSS